MLKDEGCASPPTKLSLVSVADGTPKDPKVVEVDFECVVDVAGVEEVDEVDEKVPANMENEELLMLSAENECVETVVLGKSEEAVYIC